MKTKIERNSDKKYPCLKISRTGCVVLFQRAKTGSVIHENDDYYGIGQHSSSWAEQDFEPFNGQVILEN